MYAGKPIHEMHAGFISMNVSNALFTLFLQTFDEVHKYT